MNIAQEKIISDLQARISDFTAPVTLPKHVHTDFFEKVELHPQAHRPFKCTLPGGEVRWHSIGQFCSARGSVTAVLRFLQPQP